MAPRTIGALALQPTGNAQGSYQFFSLSSGRVLTRNRATALPMPDDVIEQVHRIARRQKAHAGMVFENRNRVRVEEFHDDDKDSEMDEEYVPDGDEESSAQYDTDDEVDNTDDEVSQDAPEGAHEVPDIAGVDPEDEIEDGNVEDVENDNGLDGNNDNNNDDENYYANAASEEDPESEGEENEEDVDGGEIAGVDDDNEEIEEEVNDGEDYDHGIQTQEEIMDDKYGKRSGRYELRPRKQRDYSHLFVTRRDAFQNSNRGTQKNTSDAEQNSNVQASHSRLVNGDQPRSDSRTASGKNDN